MDCCQLEENIVQRGVKREEAGGNDPENGSPDADKGGTYRIMSNEHKINVTINITKNLLLYIKITKIRMNYNNEKYYYTI